MCESNAYLVKEGKEELLMESMDILEPLEEEGHPLVDIFGTRKSSRPESRA